MSRAELELIQELRTREREVRAHEQAHIAAGGRFVQGGASFTYRMGPDGRMYAVGGEVSIDTSPVPGDPQATLEKSRQIRRAALAPSEPSAQDLRAAAKAAQMAAEARAEMRQDVSSGTEAPGTAQAEQRGFGLRSWREGAGSRERPWISPLQSPPPRVAQQAYLRQSDGHGFEEQAAGQRLQRRA